MGSAARRPPAGTRQPQPTRPRGDCHHQHRPAAQPQIAPATGTAGDSQARHVAACVRVGVSVDEALRRLEGRVACPFQALRCLRLPRLFPQGQSIGAVHADGHLGLDLGPRDAPGQCDRHRPGAAAPGKAPAFRLAREAPSGATVVLMTPIWEWLYCNVPSLTVIRNFAPGEQLAALAPAGGHVVGHRMGRRRARR
jgi:hypothetical protein